MDRLLSTKIVACHACMSWKGCRCMKGGKFFNAHQACSTHSDRSVLVQSGFSYAFLAGYPLPLRFVSFRSCTIGSHESDVRRMAQHSTHIGRSQIVQ